MDISRLRYVLYARKSTRGDERQERSIGDQIAECKRKLPSEIHITEKDIVTEKESAKEPNIRPVFKQMISDIEAGKYDGIIAWHPDRLARNMREAGILIDLLDKKIIKDMQFATFTFENSPMGKMLLGMSFVLSKQYSDHLQESVTRGNRRITEEGRILNKFKHGYRIDKERRAHPDGDNWLLIKKVFEMYQKGNTQESIAQFLNDNHYSNIRYGKAEHERFIMRKKNISEILRDPFYAGVQVYGEHVVSLQDHYDFIPLITVPEFLNLNKEKTLLSNKFKLAKRNRSKTAVRADFLREIVFCGECSKHMSTGITSTVNTRGERKERFYFRCETPDCIRKGKSVRAKVVLEFVHKYLENHLYTSKDAYAHYQQEMSSVIQERNRLFRSKLASLNKSLEHQTKSYDRTKDMLRGGEESLKRYYKDDLPQLAAEIKDTESAIDRTKADIEANKSALMTYEKFLELFENAAFYLKKTRPLQGKDAIIRKFFSNFTLQATGESKLQWYVSKYKISEPFAQFADSENVSNGRG